jgi:hypothetical protein
MLTANCLVGAAVQPRSMDPYKDLAAYGYRSVAWKERLQELRNEGGLWP